MLVEIGFRFGCSFDTGQKPQPQQKPIPYLLCIGLVWLLTLSGCASFGLKRGQDDPEAALANICELGANVTSVSGTLSVKAESPEASGLFSAFVKAVSYPEHLDMEVLNLLGGTEAKLKVDSGNYEVTTSRGKRKKGRESWGGIPMRWATALVLGRVPCPSDLNASSPRVDEDGALEVLVPGLKEGTEERFIYRFRQYEGKPWPESLQWTRTGGKEPVEVTFGFDEPDGKSGVPLRWEARSKQGFVKVRWKKRIPEFGTR